MSVRRVGLAVALSIAVLLSGLGSTGARASAPPGPSVPVDPVRPPGGAPVAPRLPAANLSGYGELVVNSTDPALVPNTGLAINLTGYSVEPFPTLSKFQVGVEESLGNYLVTFGFFQNSGSGPYPFFSVFNNTTAASVLEVVDSLMPVQPGGAYDFALAVTSGTNWTLELNGQLFGGSSANATFDFGVTEGTDLSSLGLSEVAFAQGPVVPGSTELPTAFAVERSSGWYLPDRAETWYQGDPTIRWGVAGSAQNASLFPGMIDTGSAVPIPANGSTLWSGGPVPVELALQLDPTTVPGTATSLVTASAANEAGIPLVDFPLALGDLDGASFSSAYPRSSSNGTVESALIAPNVTANTSDVVWVGSRASGAVGGARQTIELVPAMRIAFALRGPSRIDPDSTPSFTVVAELPDGAEAAGIAVTLFLDGGGSVAPGDAVTSRSGSVGFTLDAPREITDIRLYVAVDTPGYWGLRGFEIRVAPAPSPWWVTDLPGFGVVAFVALVAAGVVLALRRRPPKQALPPLALRDRPPGPAPPASGAPVPTRTPPSGGTP